MYLKLHSSVDATTINSIFLYVELIILSITFSICFSSFLVKDTITDNNGSFYYNSP